MSELLTVIIQVAQVFVLPALCVLAYLLKSTHHEIRQTQQNHETRINAHDSEIAKLQRYLLEDACTKEDFIREVTRNRQQFEKIMQRLDGADGMREAMIQIGTALAAHIKRGPE